MKAINIFGLILMCLLSIKGMAQNTYPLYETLPDAEEKKILKGFITKAQLSEDPDFAWYGETLKYFKPNKEAVAIIAEKAYDYQVLLFLGTWCHDSHQIVPKYLATLEAAEFPDHRMVIIALDRQKNGHGNLHRPLNIVNVPTIMVMKDGLEVGRIVEFGNGERADVQLAALFKNSAAN